MSLKNRLCTLLFGIAISGLPACSGGGSGSSSNNPDVGNGGEQPETVTRQQALRFLRQAAFVTREDDVTYLMENGYEAWIDQQFLVTSDLAPGDNQHGFLQSTLRTLQQKDPTMYSNTVLDDPSTLDESVIDGARIKAFRADVFWDKALHNQDQLRQRITYALSQIIVVSDISPAGQKVKFRAESLAQYYDILYQHAYGNYRDLLTDVTYSSAMGFYMTYIGSSKTAPDENYARELTQLFTIGLYELNNDGSKVGGNQNPTPAYDQSHVTELARVFTGWGLDDKQPPDTRFGGTPKTNASWISPLKLFPEHHDTGAKTILGNKVIPADQTAQDDIRQALDHLFAHNNVAPFISRHLIMRLVTSNPSPAYIQRVSAVFNDNGQGVKGDLKATVKAILLDPEARSQNTEDNFGKLEEMVIAFTHFLSFFDVKPATSAKIQGTDTIVNNAYSIDAEVTFGQGVLGADSVFNFYSNEFEPSNAYFSSNRLVAPEFQIQNSGSLINFSNVVDQILNRRDRYKGVNLGSNSSLEAWQTSLNLTALGVSQVTLYIDLSEEYAVFEQALDNEAVANGDFSQMGSGTGSNANRQRATSALLDHLSQKLFGTTLPDDYKNKIIEHIDTFDFSNGDAGRRSRATAIVTSCIRTLVTSPSFFVLQQ